MRRAVGIAVLIAACVVPASMALAHGDEEEALEKTPARALAQQALAFLSQEDKGDEAQERIEAALESKVREGVQIALLRRAESALGRDDRVAATRLIGEALTPAQETAAPGDTMGGGHEEGDSSTGTVDVNPAALEHSPEFEPDRGTAEWVGAVVGGAALLLGGLLLVRLRRRPA